MAGFNVAKDVLETGVSTTAATSSRPCHGLDDDGIHSDLGIIKGSETS